MRVYVAVNQSTGEKVMTYKLDRFKELVREFDRRDTVVITDYNINDYNVLKNLVEAADTGDAEAKELLDFIDDKKELIDDTINEVRNSLYKLQDIIGSPISEIKTYNIERALDVIAKEELY